MTINIRHFVGKSWSITALMLLVIFSQPSYSQSLTTLWTFKTSNTPEISNPTNIVQGGDGNLYGIVGTAPDGALQLMKLTRTGSLSVTPVTPSKTCVNISLLASDGNFYGFSAQSRGLCKVTQSGSSAVISTFNDGLFANNVSPNDVVAYTLIQASDGFLYGTAYPSAVMNGISSIIWKISLSGSFSALATFSSLTTAPAPYSVLVQGKDGSFYGTTFLGSTVYKVTASGTLTTLRQFTAEIPTSLVAATDGAIYGTTTGGGQFNSGRFFKIDSAGNFSALYDFQVTPNAALVGSVLIQASDGNFYGLQAVGGSKGYGAIYRMTPQGVFSVVYEFGPSNQTPATLINGSDGMIYGVTTDRSGAPVFGTIFQFTPGLSSVSPPVTAPSILSGGLVSASDFGGFDAIAPGTFMEIYGSNLATNTRSWAASDFTGTNAPTSLDGTSVTVGGQPAFINYISPGQINLLVSSSVASGPQPLVVSSPSGKSSSYTVSVNAVEPGFLAPSSFKLNGTQFAAALLPDGAFALPAGAIAGVNSRPAKPGDTITIYGIGFGPVMPYIPAGQIVQQANSIAGNLQISVGGIPATIPYAGLAPGFTGLYQFNVVVPNAPPGNAALALTLNGTPVPQTLNIAVQN